jgi:hypothetical protein
MENARASACVNERRILSMGPHIIRKAFVSTQLRKLTERSKIVTTYQSFVKINKLKAYALPW